MNKKQITGLIAAVTIIGGLIGISQRQAIIVTPANVQAAINAAQPGDVIQLRGGTYPHLSITNSGTASAPITIIAYPGEVPVIDGQVTAGAGANTITFTLPVTASSSYSAANSNFGMAYVYESGGTSALCWTASASTTTARFVQVGISSVVGNDQSSTDRRISSTFMYEAA